MINSIIISEITEGSGEGNAGNIEITAENLLLKDGSALLADTENIGNAGDIKLKVSNEIVLEGEGPAAARNRNQIVPSQITATIDSNGSGEGGDITISTGKLLVTDDGFIRTDNLSQGEAGNIKITAADSVSLTAGGEITADTTGEGSAGDIDIMARGQVFLDGQGSEISSSVNVGAIGDGGNIKITADSLSIYNGAAIVTSTFSTGKAGEITIKLSDRLTIDGADSGLFAITQDTTVAPESSDAGQSLSTSQDLTSQNGQLVTGIRGILSDDNDVDIYQITLPGNQTFSATTVNSSTNVDTRLFLFDANGRGVYFNDDVDSETVKSTLPTEHPLTPQKAGNYYLAITSYENEPLSEDGKIFGSGSFTDILGATGNGSSQPLSSWSDNGSQSGTYFIDITDSSTTPTEISGGTGGNINVRAESLSISNGAQISAESRGQGSAGNIKIDVESVLNANNGIIITTSEQSSGGAINITAKDIRLFDDSDIRTNVFNGTGGGGNINLTANTIVAVDDSDILSFARDGKGGDISFNTEGFFSTPLYRPNSPTTNATELQALDNNSRVDVNASGTVNGAITGLPDVTFIDDELTDLPDSQIDTNALIANSCIARGTKRQENSFIITGSGALRNSPGDGFVSTYSTGDVRNISENNQSSEWKKGEPIIEPQGVYKLASGELILSRECR